MALSLRKASFRFIFRRLLITTSHWDGASRRRLFSTESGRLAGKVALITGAATGIGKATATEFIRNGAKVVVADVQSEVGEDTASGLGSNASFVHCDVRKEAHVSDAVDFAVSRYGHLDIMYNNAGIAGSSHSGVLNLDMAEFDHVMSINVRGVMAGIKHGARVMVPRGTGCILCTASITGVMGGLAPLPYSTSKFAVVGIVKSVASELCRHGIRVNCISPFAVPTNFVMDGMSELYPGIERQRAVEIVHKCGELKGADCGVEDVAKAALFLASDDAKYVSGHNLVVDGGFTAFKNLRFPMPDQVMK